MAGGGSVTRLGAPDRMARLRAVVAHLAIHGATPLSELARRFEYPEHQLRADLGTLNDWCGVPPYSPGDYIEVDFVGDAVTVRVPEVFKRPPALDRLEALAVIAAGRALLAVAEGAAAGAGDAPDAHPLRTALDKLLGAVGPVDVDLGSPPFVAELEEAIADRRTVEIDHYSLHRDRRDLRRVDPGRISSQDGEWYLVARDHRSGELRVFRMDRIAAVSLTGDRFDPIDPAELDAVPIGPPDDADRVRLRLPPHARWVVEAHPVTEVTEEPDGSVTVSLQVGSLTWLERLVVRAGPGTAVLDPPELVDLPARAAGRILDRYR